MGKVAGKAEVEAAGRTGREDPSAMSKKGLPFLLDERLEPLAK